MTTVDSDDIPTSITKLIYAYRPDGHREDSFLPTLSQNQTAEFLAHFWPAIEQHIREQVAREIEAAAPNMPKLSATLAAMRAGYEAAARIAHGTDITRSTR